MRAYTAIRFPRKALIGKSCISLTTLICPKVFLASSRTIADAIAEVAYLKGIAIKKELFIITLGEESWYDSVFFADIISTFRPAQKAGESAAAAFVANFSSPVVFEKVQLKLKDEFPCSKVDHYLLDRLGSANITSDCAGSLRIMFPKHELGAGRAQVHLFAVFKTARCGCERRYPLV